MILLAVAAGFADLRPALIVLIMAVAWILVALLEFMSHRIGSTLPSYRASYWSEPEEPQPAQEPVEQVREPEPEDATMVVHDEADTAEQLPKRRWFRRKRKDRDEDLTTAPTPQPRHVRLLPSRRQETSQAAAEVADIFDGEERDKQAR